MNKFFNKLNAKKNTCLECSFRLFWRAILFRESPWLPVRELKVSLIPFGDLTRR